MIKVVNVFIETDRRKLSKIALPGETLLKVDELGVSEIIISMQSSGHTETQYHLNRMITDDYVTVRRNWPTLDRVGFYAVTPCEEERHELVQKQESTIRGHAPMD